MRECVPKAKAAEDAGLLGCVPGIPEEMETSFLINVF